MELKSCCIVCVPAPVLECNGAESVGGRSVCECVCVCSFISWRYVATGQDGGRGGGLLRGGRGEAAATLTSLSSITSGLTFNSPASVKPSSDISAKQTNGSAPSPAQSSGSGGSSSVSNKEYSRQLTALNCSVRDWITKHVNDNPLCDLNPIFRDYERHLASIERQYGASSADGGAEEKKASSSPPPASSSSLSSSSSSSAPAPAASLFSFSKSSTDDSAREKSGTGPGVTFNFGQKVDSSVLASLGSKSTPPSFSFSSSASSSTSSLFGAPGSAAPLSFSANKTSDAQPAGKPTLDSIL